MLKTFIPDISKTCSESVYTYRRERNSTNFKLTMKEGRETGRGQRRKEKEAETGRKK